MAHNAAYHTLLSFNLMYINNLLQNRFFLIVSRHSRLEFWRHQMTKNWCNSAISLTPILSLSHDIWLQDGQHGGIITVHKVAWCNSAWIRRMRARLSWGHEVPFLQKLVIGQIFDYICVFIFLSSALTRSVNSSKTCIGPFTNRSYVYQTDKGINKQIDKGAD
jgi:hypothetical protein